MYCHLIVPLNLQGLELMSTSTDSRCQSAKWIQLLAREPDEITSANPEQGIVLVNQNLCGYSEEAVLLVDKTPLNAKSGNSTRRFPNGSISPIEGPHSRPRFNKRYPPTYDWECCAAGLAPAPLR
jgi:hypothetical protein